MAAVHPAPLDTLQAAVQVHRAAATHVAVRLLQTATHPAEVLLPMEEATPAAAAILRVAAVTPAAVHRLPVAATGAKANDSLNSSFLKFLKV